MHSSSTKSLPLPLIAVLMFLAAALGAGVTTLVAHSVQTSTLDVPEGRALDVAALVERVQAVEQQLAAPQPSRSQPIVSTDRVPAGPDHDLVQRVEQIERRLDQLSVAVRAGRVADAGNSSREEAEERRQLDRAELVATSHKTLLDPRNTAEQKLKAWRELRNIPDSYDDSVVAVMTQIGLSSSDEATRADVWRQAHGRSTHPAIGTALLQALQADSAVSAREEAAETLENYLEVPGVRQALEVAAQNDVSEKVRRQAQSTLGRRRR